MICFQSWGTKFSYPVLKLRRCDSWFPASSGANRPGQGPVNVFEDEGAVEVSFHRSQ